MFDRHQAEITVMQFRGQCLPVHQSISVSWAFIVSHFVSQIHPSDFFRLLAIGMCHFLPVHHFGMACLAGSKVNIPQFEFPFNGTIYILKNKCPKTVSLELFRLKIYERLPIILLECSMYDY